MWGQRWPPAALDPRSLADGDSSPQMFWQKTQDRVLLGQLGHMPGSEPAPIGNMHPCTHVCSRGGISGSVYGRTQSQHQTGWLSSFVGKTRRMENSHFQAPSS